MRTEIWLGHEIRFVEKEPGDWWAVLADIAAALELSAKWVKQRLTGEVVSNNPIPDTLGRMQEMLIVNELGIFESIFGSHKKEAKDFKRWVYEMLRELRRASGLESCQVFRMLDRDFQRKMMDQLHDSMPSATRVDYIKANTIADKAVSSRYGFDKMLKKSEMTPEMLVDREAILNDAVDLIIARARFNLPISVSKAIYEKYTRSEKGGAA